MPAVVPNHQGAAGDPETGPLTATTVDPHLRATPVETEEEEVQMEAAVVHHHRVRTVPAVLATPRYPSK